MNTKQRTWRGNIRLRALRDPQTHPSHGHKHLSDHTSVENALAWGRVTGSANWGRVWIEDVRQPATLTCPKCQGTEFAKYPDAMNAFTLVFCAKCGGRPLDIVPIDE